MVRSFHRGTALIALVLVFTAITVVPAFGEPGAASTVFINEIHYDNTGSDSGEGVEIAGPAGTDLSTWSIVLYNGSNNLEYNTVPLSGVLANQGGGYGTLWFSISGIQNGAPDAIALVDSTSTVVQFWSYEGTLTAGDGPAIGITSTDIGVSESSSTLAGESLQLTGSGTTAGEFTWSGPTTASPDAANAGQVLGNPPPTNVVINEFVFDVDGSDTGYAFIEIAGDPDTDYSDLTILEIEGDSTGSGIIDAVIPVGTTNAAGYWTDSEDAENGTVTLLLVSDFTGALGDDLDTDNDGTLDATPWTAIVDDIAVSDGGASDRTYAMSVLAGFDGASRIPDQADTDTLGDWMRNDFDKAGFPGETGTPVIGEALNTPGAVNEPILVGPIGACGDAATLISTIQGSGFASPEDGNTHIIEGVVVGDFEGSSGLEGFFVQEEDTDVDGDPTTSEGIFVYNGSSDSVSLGDTVRVQGVVDEFFGLTELTSLTGVVVCASGTDVATPSQLAPPLTDGDREAVEGMAVQFPAGLFVTDTYNLHRYGEAWLGIGGVVEQPTNEYGGGTPEATNLADENMLRSILLDDGSGSSDPSPIPYLNADGTLRIGDSDLDATAIMSYSFGNYKLEPVDVSFEPTNPRPTGPPDVGGDIVVASMNVLNYWTTIGCGGACRGAQTAAQLDVQTDKLVAALRGMNADIIALQEIENNPAAIQALVAAMNAAEGADVWEWIGPVSQNGYPIVNEIIFRNDRVTKVGDPMSLADPAFDDVSPSSGNELGRRPVAQTFDYNGAVFTVVSNHFKSKGSACGEPSEGADGQGNCNLRRVMQAQALLGWINSTLVPIDPDVVVVGDLNAYMAEDPIVTLESELSNLVTTFDADPYSYTFFADFSFPYVGRGSLDHAFATDSILGNVTGTATWHINGDEPRFLDWYDPSITGPGEFRSSDHDPVLIGLAFTPAIEVATTVYAGQDSGAACPGAELVSGTIGDAVTYCFVVTNTGETVLGPVTLADADLGITDADMTVLSGNLSSMTPGAVTVLYYETTLSGDLVDTTTATVVLPNEEVIADTDTAEVTAAPPTTTTTTTTVPTVTTTTVSDVPTTTTTSTTMPPMTTTTKAPKAGLPITGLSLLPLLLIAAGALGLGGAFVVGARRET